MNQRNKGHKWERDVVKHLKERKLDENASTSRYSSRALDDAKVDIFTNLTLNIQCKSYSKRVEYEKILDEMPKDNKVNVIVHRFTKKKEKNFVNIGEFAILKYSDLLDIISGRKELYESKS